MEWDPKKTAIIVCDMWDDHWCKSAARRVGELAGPMNEMLKQRPGQGVFIIHAPSTCHRLLQGHAAAEARAGRAVRPRRCRWRRSALGHRLVLAGRAARRRAADRRLRHGLRLRGEKCKIRDAWTRQIATHRDRRAEDAITDDGQETWNLLAERGIDNVILCGVHLNMCVLGRPVRHPADGPSSARTSP